MARKYRITEDDPRWNWRTMGNRKAGRKYAKRYPSGVRRVRRVRRRRPPDISPW